MFFLTSELESATSDLKAAERKFLKTVKGLENVTLKRYKVCKTIESSLAPEIFEFEKLLSATFNRKQKLNYNSEDKALLSDVEKVIKSVSKNVTLFTQDVIEISKAYHENEPTTGVIIGTVAGAGIATMAPTGLLAVATTFGTASSGAAISSLSGAAATNAALAWIGGGAVSAGGGGMALGSTILGLAGPIGWGIAGITLIGGGLFYRSKNKESIERAFSQERKILEKEKDLSLKYEHLAKSVKSNKRLVGVISNHLKAITLAFETTNVITDENKLNKAVSDEIRLLVNELDLINQFMADRIELDGNV